MTKFVYLPEIKSSNDIATFRKICDELEFSAQNWKPLKVKANSGFVCTVVKSFSFLTMIKWKTTK